MARQMNFSSELLTTPPPIVDSDVSARWKRTWKREVVMTVILPDDVVDTELYVKTTKGHIGIQMDPWMSCSWKRNWSPAHPPNTQTKEKMRKYRLQRAGRRISLFRTAGSSRHSHRSPRPQPWCKNIYHKHHRRSPSPARSAARRQDPSPSAQPQWKKKTEEENWSDSTESAAEAATYHQQSATQDKVKSTILSPESPPDYERGLSTTDYIPKSPIYHPAGYSDEEEDSELDSMHEFNLDEENWDEDNSPTSPKNPNPPEEEASQKDTSSEQKAKSSTPQLNQTGDNPDNIYLDTDEVLLTGLTKIADTVNPASPADSVTEPDNCRKRRMFNSYKRLNMSYKLNEWPNQKDDQDKATQATGMDTIQEDVQPTKSSSGNNDTLVTIPLEPMTSPPAIIHPFPSTPSSQPTDVPANFSTKLNRVAKMRTGPICYKAKLVQAMSTRPRVILQRLPLEGHQTHSDTI